MVVFKKSKKHDVESSGHKRSTSNFAPRFAANDIDNTVRDEARCIPLWRAVKIIATLMIVVGCLGLGVIVVKAVVDRLMLPPVAEED